MIGLKFVSHCTTNTLRSRANWCRYLPNKLDFYSLPCRVRENDIAPLLCTEILWFSWKLENFPRCLSKKNELRFRPRIPDFLVVSKSDKAIRCHMRQRTTLTNQCRRQALSSPLLSHGCQETQRCYRFLEVGSQIPPRKRSFQRWPGRSVLR